MDIYRKYHNFIEKWLFPLLLLLYPFLTVNQGIDVADSTYSLTNFQYFDTMNGTWMVATFLSNVVGWLLMHLPFGETFLGMKCYTTFVQSALALMVYFGLRKRIAAPLLFLGEFLALGLCWCPSTVLYNYLTYVLMTAGILFLYRGLLGVKETATIRKGGSVAAFQVSGGIGSVGNGRTSFHGKRLYFVAAGICLGANVAVRMPNVVQAAFILAVWYGVLLIDKRELFTVSGWCLLGYAVGFGVPFAVICIKYGLTAYPDMVYTMFAMTEQAADYKPTSMLTGMFRDYGTGLYWLAFAGVCAAAAGLAFFVRERLYGAVENGGGNAYKITGVIIKAAYFFLLLVLLRFYWGRGMFHFRYYQYGNGSIYYPAVLLLLVTIAAAVCCVIGKTVCAEQKIMAVFVLLQIFLTPLGSNNYLYPIINNLFVAAPFLLWVVWSRFAENGKNGLEKGAANSGAHVGLDRQGRLDQYRFLWALPVCGLVVFLLIQSVGSHVNFVFQDGIYGAPRERCVETPKKAAHVYTTLENGALLEELSAFIEEEGLAGREMITYGELPGLHYLLDMPPALSTGWPDLDSYRMTEYTRDLTEVAAESKAGKELPVMIVSSAVAAYWSDDGEAINWFGVNTEKMAKDEKQRILGEWIRDYGYTEVFGNARYVVYMK